MAAPPRWNRKRVRRDPSRVGTQRSLSARPASAQRLLDGRREQAVLATWASATGAIYDPGLVAELRRELAAIGISLKVAPLRQDSSPARIAAVLGRADLTL